MFKIALTENYTAPVTVWLPGSKSKNVFDARFRRLSQPELDALLARVRDGALDDAGFAREVMCGWSGVADDGGELEFSAANLDRLLEIYPVARCIAEGFFASIAGAKQKN